MDIFYNTSPISYLPICSMAMPGIPNRDLKAGDNEYDFTEIYGEMENLAYYRNLKDEYIAFLMDKYGFPKNRFGIHLLLTGLTEKRTSFGSADGMQNDIIESIISKLEDIFKSAGGEPSERMDPCCNTLTRLITANDPRITKQGSK